ncbi:MAG: transglutaminase domain-containing protein [Deltaproteobacteria bacterium]|nr:transglutaminase domain-containing protein [Deltaproteobacteria bacterium]MBW2200204.1 transglutaminase domain-containing protein [Deltaproteobacteria bacterium]MBW2538882.1 transglutaminase domain-containing protein [Deltaproteobacteria bacterium]
MSFHNMKFFWISGAFFGIVFTVLLSIRLDLLDKIFPASANTPPAPISTGVERDTWMNVSQSGRKIGYSHTRFTKEEKGYRLHETLFMRINTMDMIHDINLSTEGLLNSDFTLASFDFKLSSGLFRFGAKGSISGNVLSVTTQSSGGSKAFDIQIKNKPYLAAGIMDAVRVAGLKRSDQLTFNVFDPATMGQAPVVVKVIGKQEILNMGTLKRATVLSLRFKGITQRAWIGENGEVLKEEGLLGISLEKTTPEEALYGRPIESSRDLTRVASIPSNVRITRSESLETLKVEISGITHEHIDLDGGRQTFKNNILTIHKESLSNLPSRFDPSDFQTIQKKYLGASPFIQSDHPKIRDLTRQIVPEDDAPVEKAKKLVAWLQNNIEKRPVISLPDALSTLANRVGDCNEHAVLLTALARAAGIPCTVETGLVYLKGRFYYHAWNLMYLGRWITVDSLFGQIPADVTHIRFSGGTPEQQLDLMKIIGKVSLKIIP